MGLFDTLVRIPFAGHIKKKHYITHVFLIWDERMRKCSWKQFLQKGKATEPTNRFLQEKGRLQNQPTGLSTGTIYIYIYSYCKAQFGNQFWLCTSMCISKNLNPIQNNSAPKL